MKDINCDYVIDYFNRSLTNEQLTLFEKHLSECTDCQHELDELAELTGVLPYLSEPSEPPIGMKQRVLDHIFEGPRLEIEEEELKTEEQINLVEQEIQTAPKQLVTPISKPIKRRKRVWTYLLAASLLLSLLGNAYAFMKLKEPNPMPTDMALLHSIKLTPSEHFNSTGEASLIVSENKLNIIVQADQLKALKGNEVYQVWLIENGKPIPAGAFTLNKNNEGRTFYSMKYDRSKKWDTIAITLEPKADNRLPQGQIVLSSKL